MNSVLEQLGLNNTFFVELAIFVVLFWLLSVIYFKPYLKLFQARHKKTIEDKEIAEKLNAQAQAKFEEYRNILHEERTKAKADVERAIHEAKLKEIEYLEGAREEARKITHQTGEAIQNQREQLKTQLSSDVESLAHNISERLLSRNV